MKKNFDNLYEKLGGTYREVNGHLIPDVALPEQTDYQIGKYGRMHLDYIKQHRRGRYTTLLTLKQTKCLKRSFPSSLLKEVLART